jgi:hypothetical protein
MNVATINYIKGQKGVAPGDDFTCVYDLLLDGYQIKLVNTSVTVEWDDAKELLKVNIIPKPNNQYSTTGGAYVPVEVFPYSIIYGFRFYDGVFSF